MSDLRPEGVMPSDNDSIKQILLDIRRLLREEREDRLKLGKKVEEGPKPDLPVSPYPYYVPPSYPTYPPQWWRGPWVTYNS